MKPTPNISHQSRHQRGAALIISLIILGIMTIIGVTNIRHSGLELKVVSSAHERSVAFEAAEQALLNIEQQLSVKPLNEQQLYSDCAGEACFNSQCQNGLCFAGQFNSTGGRQHCAVADTQSPRQVDFWRDKNLQVWHQTDRHQKLAVSGVEQPVKYIIEFLCFNNINIPMNIGVIVNNEARAQHVTPNSTPNNIPHSIQNNLAPLYRITVLATGNTGRSQVMLQSTYRVVASQAIQSEADTNQSTLKSRRLAWRELRLDR